MAKALLTGLVIAVSFHWSYSLSGAAHEKPELVFLAWLAFSF